MPRSFLVKKHHSSKNTNYGRVKPKAEGASCNSHDDSLLNDDIPPQHRCPVPIPRLQQAAKSFSSSFSSSSCSPPLKTQRLPLPSSPNTPALSLLGHCSEVYSSRPAEACRPAESTASLEIPESLLAPSFPLAALFPAIPPGGFECSHCHSEHLSFPGLAKHKPLRCEWSSKKNFICKYCKKEYVSLGALKMHIRTHTLPCVCQVCGKAFSRPWLLQGHIRTHTGEKPFSCLHCNRAFADRSNLRAHLQTHSQMKRYQCECCFKTFSRISLLSKHQETGCPLS